jgi:tetratricopeptide (TPR) repeat protein
MMSCLADNTLLEYLHGDLGSDREVEVRRHVAGCGSCRLLLAEVARAVTPAEAGSAGSVTELPLRAESERCNGDAAAPPDLAGRVAGRFVLLRLLGMGGMGAVYEAYDPELDRRVALKFLRADIRAGSRSARLVREAQALARVSHPNVVTVHDVGTVGDQVFVAMELLVGQTLKQWLTGSKPNPRHVLEVFLQAGRGLAAAHAAGVVHRDFKPDNVIVGVDGRVHVTDFGLARRADEPTDEIPAGSQPAARPVWATRTGTMVGTPAYMAPEQIRGESTTASTDQFAFCLALYEALYGERAFPATDLGERARDMAAGRVTPRPKGRGFPVPTRIRAALTRGLRASPADRFADMPALLRELARERRVTALRVAGALLVVFAMLFGAMQYRRAHRPACPTAAAELAGVWDDARRSTIHAAFVRVGGTRAAETWRRVSTLLDGYASKMAEMRVNSCEAGLVRHEQSAELTDLRMRCLSGRRESLRALTEVYSRADAAVFKHAIDAALALGPIERCGDDFHLLLPMRLPANAADRARVEEVNTLFAQARAQVTSGNVKGAHSRLIEAGRVAETAHYAPTLARALYLRGELEAEMSFPNALEHLRSAIWVADEGRDDETRSWAWSVVAFQLGYVEGKLSEGLNALEHARAAQRRLGPDLELESRLESVTAGMLYAQGKYGEAAQHSRRMLDMRRRQPDAGGGLPLAAVLFDTAMSEAELGNYERAREYLEQSLAIREKVLGPEHVLVAVARDGLGTVLQVLGHYEAAQLEIQRAIDTGGNTLGADNPAVAQFRANLCLLQTALGQLNQAVESCRAAQAVLRARMGATNWSTLSVDSSLGLALAERGDLDEAVRWEREAVAGAEAAYPAGHAEFAGYWSSLGRVLARAGRPDEAVTLHKRAIALAEKAGHERRPFALYCYLGEAELARSRPEAAAEAYTRALALGDPKIGHDNRELTYALVGLAEAEIGRGHPTKAVPLLERALALGIPAPARVGWAQFQLARARWALGDRAGARASLASATRLLAQGGPGAASRARTASRWAHEHGRANEG